jgi:hypothetical protein
MRLGHGKNRQAANFRTGTIENQTLMIILAANNLALSGTMAGLSAA